MKPGKQDSKQQQLSHHSNSYGGYQLQLVRIGRLFCK